MLQAAPEIQAVAQTGTLGLGPVSNSGTTSSPIGHTTDPLMLKNSTGSAANILFNTCSIYLDIEASVTEVLLMAVTAVRELTLLPGDTVIYERIYRGEHDRRIQQQCLS